MSAIAVPAFPVRQDNQNLRVKLSQNIDQNSNAEEF